MKRTRVLGAILFSLLAASVGAPPANAKKEEQPAPRAAGTRPNDQYAAVLRESYEKMGKTKGGKNADYIPALAEVPSDYRGIVIVTVDGRIFQIGDTDVPFTIQSVAKPFTLALVADELGADAVEKNIGVNQTGQKFNSLGALEQDKEHPAGNGLVNAGAITAVSLVPGNSASEKWSKIMHNFQSFAGERLEVNQEVYVSETATNQTNQAITALLKRDDVVKGDPQVALDLYTRECSVDITARQLAVMGATLANGGKNPLTGQQVVKPETAEHILSQMATNGLYENTGAWLYDVGVPAKSGVGGGIVAVVPGKYAIATFSPPLDEAGNSVRGQAAIDHIVSRFGDSLFRAKPAATSAR
jgi:glutaminase